MAGNTSQLRKFEIAMMQIRELNPDAERWLRKIPLEMWTSRDGGYRYGQATTNMQLKVSMDFYVPLDFYRSQQWWSTYIIDL